MRWPWQRRRLTAREVVELRLPTPAVGQEWQRKPGLPLTGPSTGLPCVARVTQVGALTDPFPGGPAAHIPGGTTIVVLKRLSGFCPPVFWETVEDLQSQFELRR